MGFEDREQPGAIMPLPAMVALRAAPSPAWAATPMDAGGRLADASPVRARGWLCSDQVRIRIVDGSFIARRDVAGPGVVSLSGHLHLPAGPRRPGPR